MFHASSSWSLDYFTGLTGALSLVGVADETVTIVTSAGPSGVQDQNVGAFTGQQLLPGEYIIEPVFGTGDWGQMLVVIKEGRETVLDLSYGIAGEFSGDVDVQDMDKLVHDLVETTIGTGTEYGDFNLDGLVGLTDLARIGTYWGNYNTWACGDANGDGKVDLVDLSRVGTYWGFAAAPDGDTLGPAAGAADATAEPATMADAPVMVEDRPLTQPVAMSMSLATSPIELLQQTTLPVDSIVTGVGLAPTTEVTLLSALPGVLGSINPRVTGPVEGLAPTARSAQFGQAKMNAFRARHASRKLTIDTSAPAAAMTTPQPTVAAAEPTATPAILQADLVDILYEAQLLITL